MALNRFNPHGSFFGGFDDFFAPSPFFRNTPMDLMPVLLNVERDQDMFLTHASPGYEITEDDKKYQIHVDMPGVKTEDIKVDFENNDRVVHISGGRKVEKEGKYMETRFSKRFTIGDNVDKDKMVGNLDNGVLTLTAPKIEKIEPPKRAIAITQGPYQPTLGN